jgi:hypothetical protein
MGIRLPCAVAVVALMSEAGDPFAAADGLNESLDRFDRGTLLATAGVNELEGVGGGVFVPWALITGYGTSQAIGAGAHFTHIALPDDTIERGDAAAGMDREPVPFRTLNRLLANLAPMKRGAVPR